jgi:hypothetical protein
MDTACTPTKCSLRDAVTFANAGDTVVLPASTTPYAVTLGEIKVPQPLTIKGAGASKSVIEDNGSSRVFEVTATPTSTSTVTFDGVTISGGHATTMPGGGGILVDFVSNSVALNLVLDSAVVSGNSATVLTGANTCCAGGGGIYSSGGDVTLSHSTVMGNTATVRGGTSTAGNTGQDGGGGIFANDGSIKAVSSTVANNAATVKTYGGFNGGGGLYENGFETDGAVTISKSKLQGNSFTLHGTQTDGANCCSGGGAVYQDALSTVTVSRSRLSGNKATISSGGCCHGGGAIFHDNDQFPVIIRRSTLDQNSTTVSAPTTTDSSDNHGSSGGGAVASFNGIQLTNSTLDGNTSNVTSGDSFNGGGAINLDSHGAQGALTAMDSTISNNTSLISGAGTFSGAGGVYEDTSTSTSSTYTNSTIAGNTTNATQASNGGGGGLLISQFGSPSVADVLANATIAGNSASAGTGGGVLNVSSNLQSKDSIVALNRSGHHANCAGSAPFGPPVFTSLGYNLTTSRDSCQFTGTGDQVVPRSAVRLEPLAKNGGPTETRAELVGSPAIDAGNPAGCTDPNDALLTTDQRGLPRPDNGETGCDIGAYEYQDTSTK